MNKHIESDQMLKALIFDVDGTLADTESAHLAAFNHAFDEQGLDWHWDLALYTGLLEISGGKERMLHYWKHVHPEMKDIDGSGLRDTIEHLHALKTAAYEAAVQGGAVQLRPGVLALIKKLTNKACVWRLPPPPRQSILLSCFATPLVPTGKTCSW